MRTVSTQHTLPDTGTDKPADLTAYGPPALNIICLIILAGVVIAAAYRGLRVAAWVMGW